MPRLRTCSTAVMKPQHTNKIGIAITSAAWNKMTHIYSKTNKKEFLFAASSGGCAGLNYEFKNVERHQIDELITSCKITPTFINNDNISVYIDPLSEMYLIGTTIDYIEEDYNDGIYESKFTFIPNKDTASLCGCGISFYPKDAES